MDQATPVERTRSVVEEFARQHAAVKRKRYRAMVARDTASARTEIFERLHELAESDWNAGEAELLLIRTVDGALSSPITDESAEQLREIANSGIRRCRPAGHHYARVADTYRDGTRRLLEEIRRRDELVFGRFAALRDRARTFAPPAFDEYPPSARRAAADAVEREFGRVTAAMEAVDALVARIEEALVDDLEAVPGLLDEAEARARAVHDHHTECVIAGREAIASLLGHNRERAREAYHSVIRHGEDEQIAIADDEWASITAALAMGDIDYYGPDPETVFSIVESGADRLEGLEEA